MQFSLHFSHVETAEADASRWFVVRYFDRMVLCAARPVDFRRVEPKTMRGN